MEKLEFKKYFLFFAFFTLAMLMCVAFFNWFVNPYDIYSSPAINGFNVPKTQFGTHQRMSKAYAIRKVKPEAIVLGSSRAEIGIDPGHKGWSNSPVYNLAIPSTTIYEVSRYFQHANNIHSLKQVLLAADFFIFTTAKMNQSDFEESQLSVSYDGENNPFFNVAASGASLLSVDAVFSSINTVKQHTADSNIRSNGFQIKPDTDLTNGYRAIFIEFAKGWMQNTYLPNRFEFNNQNANYYPFKYYRKILQTAYRDNIDLRIALSPSHARQWEALAAGGLWSDFEYWKLMLVSINEEESALAEKSPFPLWDFSTYNEFTTESVPPIGDKTTNMKWYWDPSHYKKELGDLMLDRIFGIQQEERVAQGDFGVLITGDNINSHLQRLRADRQNYRDTHPDDIAEIETLANNQIK